MWVYLQRCSSCSTKCAGPGTTSYLEYESPVKCWVEEIGLLDHDFFSQFSLKLKTNLTVHIYLLECIIGSNRIECLFGNHQHHLPLTLFAVAVYLIKFEYPVKKGMNIIICLVPHQYNLILQRESNCAVLSTQASYIRPLHQQFYPCSAYRVVLKYTINHTIKGCVLC